MFLLAGPRCTALYKGALFYEKRASSDTKNGCPNKGSDFHTRFIRRLIEWRRLKSLYALFVCHARFMLCHMLPAHPPLLGLFVFVWLSMSRRFLIEVLEYKSNRQICMMKNHNLVVLECFTFRWKMKTSINHVRIVFYSFCFLVSKEI